MRKTRKTSLPTGSVVPAGGGAFSLPGEGGSDLERREITGQAPKYHVPVFAYSGEGDGGVLARRVPEGWWIRDDNEAPLGWIPVAFRQAD